MIKLAYDNTTQRGDLVYSGSNLDTDAGLETAVTISLFTDGRAREDDDIETAQQQKLDYLCRKLRLQPGERLIDFG